MGCYFESLRLYDKHNHEEARLKPRHVHLWTPEGVIRPFINKPNCSDLIMTAEPELAALFHAVMELFGAEQAELSAEEWLRELMAIEDLPASTREWRQITIKVAARLATRLNASSVTPISGAQHQSILSPILSELSAIRD